MKRRTEGVFKEGLQAAAVLSPDDWLEHRVDDGNENRPGENLRPETGTLGNTAGDDRRDTGSEAEQEEETDQLKSLVWTHQLVNRLKEMGAVGNVVADDKIDNGWNRPVGKYFDKSIDLAFFTDCSDFEKSEPGMHGKNHDRTEHKEKNVTAVTDRRDGRLHCHTLLIWDFKFALHNSVIAAASLPYTQNPYHMEKPSKIIHLQITRGVEQSQQPENMPRY